jgi:hypothetical protein
MLLGCCHCGETPSESFPPSDSASDSGSAPDFTYGICDCAAVPKIWEVVWPAMDANAVCPIAAGTYELIKTADKTVPGGTPSTYCNWESTTIAPRMKVITGAWACETWTPPAFRIMVAPSIWSNHLKLFVFYSVWVPSGFGGSYQDSFTTYQNDSGSSSPCIHNGAMTLGGSTVLWPNKTDVTFPYTSIAMPAPATITIRPKL